MSSIWVGSMTLEQALSLEPVFAKLTDAGWVIPQWLVELKQAIQLKELSK